MYTVKQVVAMTGLTAATLRIWERRYGVVNPARTAGHYRVFSEAEVARLRAMVQLVEAGATASKAAEIVMSEALTEPTVDDHTEIPPTRLGDLASRFDVDAITDLLSRTVTLDDFEWSIDEWLRAAMTDVVHRHTAGELTIAHVRGAERAIKRHLGTLLDQTRATTPAGSDVAPIVLVGQEEESGRELIPLIFCVALRRCHIDARYLGGNISRDAWLAAAQQLRPRAVALAVTTREGVDDSQALAAELAELRPPIAVWLGGPTLKPQRGVRGMLPMDLKRATRTVLNHLRAGGVRLP